MRTARRLYQVLILALALALGQYAGLLHGLGHATEQLAHKHGTPVKVACDQCFACSQLSGGAPSMPALDAPRPVRESHRMFHVAAASIAATVVFRSRAPPVLS